MAALALDHQNDQLKQKEPEDNIKAIGFNACGFNQTGCSFVSPPPVEILDLNISMAPKSSFLSWNAILCKSNGILEFNHHHKNSSLNIYWGRKHCNYFI